MAVAFLRLTIVPCHFLRALVDGSGGEAPPVLDALQVVRQKRPQAITPMQGLE
jgi:hypothetical protein